MDEFSKSLPQLCQSMIKTAANTITCTDVNTHASQEILNDLRNNLEKYCKNTERYKKINETTTDILSQPEDSRKALLEKYCENINSYDPNTIDNDYMKEYDDRVAALMKSTTYNSQKDTTDDEELLITQNSNINLVCPISKSKMTEPMKNIICGHVYDKSSIVSLLQVSNHTRCPIVGCGNKEYLRLEHLKCDIVTQMTIETNAE